MTRPTHLKFEDLSINYGSLPFKGRLLAATPSRNRPRGMPEVKWCSSVAELILDHPQIQWVIPRGFWAKGRHPWAECGSWELPRHIALHDFSVNDTTGTERLPRDVFQEVIGLLKKGQDVAVLSSTKRPLIFPHLAIHYIQQPYAYSMEKTLCWADSSERFELGMTQRAYLLGLDDGCSLSFQQEDFRDDEENWLGDKNKPELASSWESNVLRKENYALEQQIKSFSHELLSEISPELISLTQFLNECEDAPNMDVSMGGMASIGYRLCEVFKETGTLGYELSTGTEDETVGGYDANKDISGLKQAHEVLHSKFGLLADRLERLDTVYLSFLYCDFCVLQDHPEVTGNTGISEAIKLIAAQFEVITDRLAEIGLQAREIQCAPLGQFAPRPVKKDRDWLAVQALLADCLRSCGKDI